MANVFNDEEKAIFEELKAAASDQNVALDAKSDPTIEMISLIAIRNHTKEKKVLQLIDNCDWSGRPYNSYPKELPNVHGPVQFQHLGPLPVGSVAGVVYGDGDAEDSTARKWLVAFDRIKEKVYVEAGPMGKVDWNVIKVKLDASESSSYYEDPALGGKAGAVILTRVSGAIVVMFSN